jgi:hypothetical protein
MDEDLRARIERLERIVEANKLTAGTAADTEHREVIHEVTEPRFSQAATERSEIRQSVVDSEARGMERVGTIRDRLNELVPAIKEMQSTTLALLTTGALFGAALLFIAVRALGF